MGIMVSKPDDCVRAYNLKNDASDVRNRETTADDNRDADTSDHVAVRNGMGTTHIQVRIHDETGDPMISVIDDSTGEVIREIPPEKFLDMIVAFQKIDGIFIDRKV